jgi:hypothetical protein
LGITQLEFGNHLGIVPVGIFRKKIGSHFWEFGKNSKENSFFTFITIKEIKKLFKGLPVKTAILAATTGDSI